VVLSAADDDLHPPASDDGSWTETAWFAGAVPERGLVVWTYPLFRPELGIMSCGVYVWETGAEELWQLPYYRTWWHLPIPEGISATRFELSNGLSYECLEPLTAYRIRYADGDEMRLDMTFTALHAPHPVGVAPGGRGHLDQLGRVTGELRLRGERLAIECLEMRDRTWSPRRESRQGAYVSYSYGASSPESAFHVSTRWDHERGRAVPLTGFVLRDGETTGVPDGACEVSRDERGRPVGVRVRGTDANGRAIEAVGLVVSRMALPSTPWFVWACLVRWTLDDGTTAYGEHQDTWSPGMLRAFLAGAGGRGA
jgi:hypothetical protein